jgi:Flp pilus assembly protein TadG
MRPITSRKRRLRRGNVFIEFGLAFPLLFVFLSGSFELGYGFFLYDRLESMVRTGARYASVIDFDSAQGGSTFRTNVQNMVVYGTPSGGGSPLVLGLTTSKVNVTWQADAAGIPQTIKVAISNYQFRVLGATFLLTNKPFATFIYLGQFKT